jgi:adenylosuccinate lyase
MIAWKYLDKKTATINALKDYENMTCIIHLTPEDIKTLEDSMSDPRSSASDGMPHNENPHSQEQRIINELEKIDALRQRYRQAVEFMDWFQPAWDALRNEEQMILSEMFLISGIKVDTVKNLSERLVVDRSNVYRRRDKALEHLSVLLYGY